MKIGGISMAKILITGATGTIGLELTKHLVHQHELTVVGRDFSEFPDDLKKQVTVIKKDLVNPKNWANLLDHIEYVIQLAGEADAKADFYGDLLELNYKLPHNLFKEAIKAKELKRIIFASSIHAVGRSEEHTSELQSRGHLVCRLLLEKKNTIIWEWEGPQDGQGGRAMRRE